jgi:pimeloyl-ACP methyl ester carboxylesterase
VRVERWIELRRETVRLACLDFGGTGDAVLLLHGLAGHAGEWRAMARLLTRAHRVLALDQRGHGRSATRPADVSREAFVADAVWAIDQLELAPVTLVGQSMGGNTAFLLAAQRPDLVKRLIVIEASPDGPLADLASTIAAQLDLWPIPFGSRDAAMRFFDERGLAPEAWTEGLQTRDDGLWPAFDRRVMVSCIANLARRGYWQEWRSIGCPALVVVGRAGQVSLRCARDMAGAIAAGEAVEIPTAGHDLHLEAVGALWAAAEPFLAKTRFES